MHSGGGTTPSPSNSSPLSGTVSQGGRCSGVSAGYLQILAPSSLYPTPLSIPFFQQSLQSALPCRTALITALINRAAVADRPNCKPPCHPGHSCTAFVSQTVCAARQAGCRRDCCRSRVGVRGPCWPLSILSLRSSIISSEARAHHGAIGPPRRTAPTASHQSGSKMSTVTPLEHTLIGGTAGLMEVCIMQVSRAARGRPAVSMCRRLRCARLLPCTHSTCRTCPAPVAADCGAQECTARGPAPATQLPRLLPRAGGE